MSDTLVKMTLAEEIARKHLSSVAIRCTECVAALNEMAERIFEQTRERAAQIAAKHDLFGDRLHWHTDAACPRLITQEIRAMKLEDIAGSESAK